MPDDALDSAEELAQKIGNLLIESDLDFNSISFHFITDGVYQCQGEIRSLNLDFELDVLS